MTLSAGANAHAAAAGNWLWLTGLTRTDDALFAGDADDPLPTVLALQFAHLVSLDRARDDTAATLTTMPDNAFDYVVLPGILEWWRDDAAALFRTTHRLLRPDGWVALTGRRDQRPRRMAGGLRRAGFREVRTYGLAPSHAQPYMTIPGTRSAALACEQDFRRQRGGNRVRIALAAAGLHRMLYSGWLVLAKR